MSGYVYMPWDCCRCRNEECVDKEFCLRYVARDDIGFRTPFFDWSRMPVAKSAVECGHFIRHPPRRPEIELRGPE